MVFYSVVVSWPYLKTLDYSAKAYLDKHSSLVQKFLNHVCKKFYNIRPRKGNQFVGGVLGATAGYVLASSLLNSGGYGSPGYYPNYYGSYQAPSL